MEWYLTYFKKQANGRANRKEYWLFILFNSIILFCAVLFIIFLQNLNVNFGENISSNILMVITAFIATISVIYWLLITYAFFFLAIRRLHDLGKSGFWLFIVFVPFFGGIIWFIFTLLPGQPFVNKYGPIPK